MLKKLGIGAYIACGTILLAVISWIIYGANVLGAGYFQGQGVPFVVLFTILAIVCECLAIVLGFVKKDGIVGKVLGVLQSLLLVGGIVLLMSSALLIIGNRAQGLGFIFGADENARAEFTADDYASAGGAIISFVFYMVSWLVAVFVPFFKITKEEVAA